MDPEGMEPFVHAGPAAGVPAMVGYRQHGLVEGTHLGLPGPRLTFILSLDGPVVSAPTADALAAGRAVAAEVLLAGMHQRATHVRQPARQEGVQLAVDPLAARRLFGMPAAELGGAILDEGALDAGWRRLWQRVGDTGGWRQRFALVAAELHRRAPSPSAGRSRPEVAEAWRWLGARRGRGRVDELCAHVHLGPRQLRSEFHRELGIGPKTAARLMRFEHAVSRVGAAVRSGRTPSLAGVAADCGYADQSHLTRDFRQLVGLSPTAWLDQERRNLQAGGHQREAG
jgi:AraC-like DNA-binding protein